MHPATPSFLLPAATAKKAGRLIHDKEETKPGKLTEESHAHGPLGAVGAASISMAIPAPAPSTGHHHSRMDYRTSGSTELDTLLVDCPSGCVPLAALNHTKHLGALVRNFPSVHHGARCRLFQSTRIHKATLGHQQIVLGWTTATPGWRGVDPSDQPQSSLTIRGKERLVAGAASPDLLGKCRAGPRIQR